MVDEIVSGILAGRLVLPAAVRATLLPSSITPLLGALATIGLALFMFTVGYEPDPTMLRGPARGRSTSRPVRHWSRSSAEV